MQSITLRSGLERKSHLSRTFAALKLQLRALACPRMTSSWLHLLNSHSVLRDLAIAQPRLIHKIYRPWLSHRMCQRQRLSALMSHYHFILQQGLGELVADAARRPVELARFAGKSGALYNIALCAIVPMEREGELVLQLRCGEALVYSVAFSFLGAGREVGIGCIQGPQHGAGLELAREATRDLFGLRPKNLLVRLVRQLGHAYGCNSLVLVGNGNRTVARKSIRLGKVKADYDGLWQEMGARQRQDGDYELDCEPLLPPSMEDVPSKKRSEVRKRHELLEAVNAAVLARLAPDCAIVSIPATDAPQPRERSRIELVTAACAVAN
ncbi:DUF535 family protein [Pseudoduganella sp. RAF19]|uniref:DUF535 family protein n=2 Tax=unclassified Pseudoduganella TaxID=2637179 RepID=UPI003F9D3976